LTSSKLIPVANPLAQRIALKTEIDEAVERVLAGGHYVLGPEVEAFEAEFSDYIGVDHSVGVANGTDAIALALRALGMGPGDEVITVSHTAVATVAAIEMAGCTPVLVDVEPGYLTLDPSKLDEVFTARTRAIVAVHLYGQPADLDRIQEFCDRTGVALIEDVSQGHGSRWHGRRTGSFGHVSTFSCYPTKNLGAIGDAGIVATNDRAIADRLRRLRQYGWVARNDSIESGVNSRLDELQAAILRVKLRHLDSGNAARRAIAGHYTSALTETRIQPPTIRPEAESVFHLYVVEDSERDALRADLAQRGVATAVHYPLAVHQQSAYRGRIRTSSSMAVTEDAVQRILSLPMYPELPEAYLAQVVIALKGVTA
jgi:dTDP-4-amino-4,6-dideoxygalactose transaminase